LIISSNKNIVADSDHACFCCNPFLSDKNFNDFSLDNEGYFFYIKAKNKTRP